MLKENKNDMEKQKEYITLKEKYNSLWDNGGFSFNGKMVQGINPQRIWNVFIAVELNTAKEQAKKEAREDILDEINNLYEENPTHGALMMLRGWILKEEE
jgi:hypothetical protein